MALLLNGVFWVYFWISFALASQPNDGRFCMDQCLDPYVFFGYGIGLSGNPLALTFMKIMIAIELPSFAVVTYLTNLLTGEPADRLFVGVFGDFAYGLFPGFPNSSGGILYHGISINGYRLLATMLLSFFQWFLIAKILTRLIKRFNRR